MLKIGVQSGHLYDDDSIEYGFNLLKECGFDCVDFNIDTKLSFHSVVKDGKVCEFFQRSDDELREYYRPHKEAIEKYGITYSQMHAPFPLYVVGNDFANDQLFNSVVRCLMICEYLKCPYLIVHPSRLEESPIEEERALNLDFYTRLIPFAKEYGVKICLENIFKSKGGLMTESTCSDMNEVVDYIDTLNCIAGEEVFAVCFDLGHATLLGKDIRRSINILGSRLQALHIHDNDSRNDLHMQPYAYTRGTGYVTDWDGFIAGLRDIGFNGVLSFETYHSLLHLPKPLVPAMLHYIADVGKYFAEKIDEPKTE